ncbi:hypothetical protein SISSUDRAFT_1116602 [Sistotremastrum suecicum HHB10207 ss-3]|uniref:Uncharacterized protein n=1 Tax=Sistotremastrum suecicum HHB10207 ss-3 TaxID=1314776 RepID=A0A166HZR3_9AGAM|nr:hypothetical protein SISSUDRAFT_1116602 [Sistotremastrum suecicum HHB10207 ss-3]
MASQGPDEAGTSKRYTHLHSALQLATQRASNKWTFEDFEECFPLWCAEERNGAQSIMSVLARGMQEAIEKDAEDILQAYGAPAAIDTLHQVVTEARERKKSGYTGKDVWKPDLEPRAAVRARTIPVLENERDRLLATLQELESDNEEMMARLQKLTTESDEADANAKKLLDTLDKTVESFSALPTEDMLGWTLTSIESTKE